MRRSARGTYIRSAASEGGALTRAPTLRIQIKSPSSARNASIDPETVEAISQPLPHTIRTARGSGRGRRHAWESVLGAERHDRVWLHVEDKPVAGNRLRDRLRLNNPKLLSTHEVVGN